MARRETATLAMVVVTGLCSGSIGSAAELQRVVAHVTDYQPVEPAVLCNAQRLVIQAYARIGVELVWAGPPDGQRPDDASLHVRVSILNSPMSEKSNPDVSALGQGSHVARQACVYYSRIVDFARQTHSHPARVLATVLAHELGHVLLPEYSHAPWGLMRPTCAERIVSVPPFLPAQASAIRQMLTSGR
jgi:hypothetical protein